MKAILSGSTGEILLFPAKFSKLDLMKDLDSFALKQESIKLFGKEVMQPRLSALYGEPNSGYKYSGKFFEAITWSGKLKKLAEDCSRISGLEFNTGLLNYYRDGKDSMGLHADDERELGKNPIIASVSFGATRKMIFRNKVTKEKLVVPLNHGDLIVMKGSLQHQWKHELPKEKRVEEARLNVTFRKVN